MKTHFKSQLVDRSVCESSSVEADHFSGLTSKGSEYSPEVFRV
jgi:hypothetical protein